MPRDPVNCAALWLDALHDLAWRKLAGTPLTADRRAHFGNVSLMLEGGGPYPRLPELQSGHRDDWVQEYYTTYRECHGYAPWWSSTLPDLAAASVAAIDLLLSCPEHAPLRAEPASIALSEDGENSAAARDASASLTFEELLDELQYFGMTGSNGNEADIREIVREARLNAGVPIYDAMVVYADGLPPIPNEQRLWDRFDTLVKDSWYTLLGRSRRPLPATLEGLDAAADRIHDAAAALSNLLRAGPRPAGTRVPATTDPVGDSWPPSDGWHFRRGDAAFRGVVFTVTNMSWRLFEAVGGGPAAGQ